MKPIGYIYLTTCLANGKIYVGRHHSEETRKHWSEIRKGRKLSEETKKKMSLAHKKKK